jgi:hypothetical protein
MELAYVAHAARCALLLDADGICRWFLLKSEDESVAATAKRCVGAQFVATLDPDVSGLLGHEPAVGKNILFARVDDGRVTLVRFGPLVEFETLGAASAPRESEVELPAPPAIEPATEPAIEAAIEPPPATIQERRRTIVASPPPPPPAPTSEPPTMPAGSALAADDDDDDDEHRADVYQSDEDAIATSAFSRAAVLRASRRGMLPRRG